MTIRAGSIHRCSAHCCCLARCRIGIADHWSLASPISATRAPAVTEIGKLSPRMCNSRSTFTARLLSIL